MARSSSISDANSHQAEAIGARRYPAVRGESFAATVLIVSSPAKSVRNCLRPAKITPLTLAISGLGPVSTSFPSSRGRGPGLLRWLRRDIALPLERQSVADPRLGAAGDVAQRAQTVPRQQRRCGRRAIAAGADDGQWLVVDLGDAARQLPERDVAGAGNVAGGELHRPADIEDGDAEGAKLPGGDLRQRGAVVSGAHPRQEAAVEVTGHVLHPHARQARHRLAGVLHAVGDDDDALLRR